MPRSLIAIILALATVAPAAAQNFAPAPPPPARGVPGAVATICSAEPGWCPLPTALAPGAPCYCFVPPATWLPGTARHFPYQGPVSPYLNPHVGPPSILR